MKKIIDFFSLRGFLKDANFFVRFSVTITFACFVVYASFTAFIYTNQELIIFRPSKSPSDFSPQINNLTTKACKVKIDKKEFYAWYFEKAHTKRCLVYFYGNADSVNKSLNKLKWLSEQLDCSIFAFDYPGYGRNPGKASESSIDQLLPKWINFLQKEIKVSKENLLLWGHSLGGAVAVKWAQKFEPKIIVLEGTFYNMVKMAGEVYPFLPIDWICRNRFDTNQILTKINAQIILIHSKDDKVVPYHHSKQLFELLKSVDKPVQLFETKGGHSSSYREESENYRKKLRQLIPIWTL